MVRRSLAYPKPEELHNIGRVLMASDTYQLYAVKYAHHDRRAHENFLQGDPHDTAPMPLDYFVWAIVGESRTFILDTGFDAAIAKKRGREFLTPPGDGLKMIGIDPDSVKDVIISHMHYDHTGNNALFPNATYHIQDREMAFCTGRCMCHPQMRRSFEEEDVTAMIGRVFRGRVQFHDGVDELAPGLTVHHVGGHTAGLQVVRVKTERGWVVLAADASHFYANFEQMRAYPTVYNVGDMLEGFATVRRLGTSLQHVVPGHDPLVFDRYPAAKPGLEGIAVRLDVAPKG
jgi:glyoxylase-like metal-dependent hydrolase (beta-lactamase superfamily II)